jgi:hypothetical protein
MVVAVIVALCLGVIFELPGRYLIIGAIGAAVLAMVH